MLSLSSCLLDLLSQSEEGHFRMSGSRWALRHRTVLSSCIPPRESWVLDVMQPKLCGEHEQRYLFVYR